MGGATNSQGQTAAVNQINNFVSNLPSQGYSGKDGTANLAADTYGVGVSGLYAGMAAAAGEVGSLPGPIGWTGTAVNVVVGVATSGGAASPTCAVVGVVAAAAAGVVAGAAATPTGPVGQFLAGAFVGVGAQKIATAACQTALGYINGEAPATPAQAQTTAAQSLQNTVASSNLPQAPTVSTPPQATASDLASQVIQFRPSPDYTGTNGAYTVQSGQTLTSIAASNGITLSQLIATNPQITDPNSIRMGQVIQLPSNASGYTSDPQSSTTPSIPDNATQTTSLANTLDLAAGTNVVVVTENSGRIAVLSTTTGQATLIANDGSISTESLATYNQQAQVTYNGYLANGYINNSSQVAYADYQNGLYGTVSADGQTGTVQTSTGLISKDASGDITAVSNAGQLYQYDQANSNNLFAGDTGTNGTLSADIQTKTASGTVVDDTRGYTTGSAVQYEMVQDTTSTGVVTDTISGSGAVANLSNATVTLLTGASAAVNGTNDVVTAGANVQASVAGTGNTINVSGTGDALNTSGSQVNLWANTLSSVTGNNNVVVAEGGNVDALLVGNGNQIASSTAGNGFAISGTSATLNVFGDGVTFGANSSGVVSGNANAIATGGSNVNATLVGNSDRIDSSIAGSSFTINGSGATVNLSGDSAAFEANSDGVVSGNANTISADGGNVHVSVIGNGDQVNSYTANNGFAVVGAGATLNLYGDGVTFEANSNGLVTGNSNSIAAAGANVAVSLAGNNDRVDSFIGGNGFAVTGTAATLNVSGDGVTFEANSTGVVNGNANAIATGGRNVNATVVGNSDRIDSSIAGSNFTVNGSSATVNLSGDSVAFDANSNGSVNGNANTVTAAGGNVQVAVVGNSDSVNSSVAGNGFAVAGSGDTLSLIGDGVTFETNSSGVVNGNANAIAAAGANVHVALAGNGDRVDSSIAGNGFSVNGSGDTMNLTGDGVTFQLGSTGVVNGNGNAIASISSTDVTLVGNGNHVDSSGGADNYVINGTATSLNVSNDTVTFEANSNGAVNGSGDVVTAAGSNIGVALTGNVDQVYSSVAGNSFSATGRLDMFDINGDHLAIGSGSMVFVSGSSDSITESSNDYVDVSGSADVVTGNSSDVTDVSGTGDSVSGGTSSDGVPVVDPSTTCPNGVDPILLNLQGGRVQTQGLNMSTARFDMQNNGQAVQTGWGTAGEGYLVYDPNDAGNTTAVTHDSQLVAGFGALQSLAQQVDGTGSGALNASDTLWGDLKVWVDTTGTGQFQSGQLYSLDQLGIAGINLDATHVNQDSNGNTILDDSTFTWANGSTGDIAGANLQYYGTSEQAHAGVDALVQAMASFAPTQSGTASVLNPALLQTQSPLLAAEH